ncbi:MAG TPA: fumarylacetoacetate hydrolase family protein [Nitrospirota bacterium]|nr:fumarylacetoacetate hydrolase family protein [Nitrospirota bacterium]
MRLARFHVEGREACGIVQGGEIQELVGNLFDPLIIRTETHRLADANLLAPCKPSKIVAVGLNYQDHAHELGFPIPENPIIFLKPPTSVIGTGGRIVVPAMSSRIDFEAELGIVIKNATHCISPEDAADHILGYTCANDVTARDLQKRDGQWTRSKAFDTFCPLGPWIETDLDPGNLLVESYLNGKRMQSSRTSQLIFPITYVVSFTSHIMTLHPGDLIITGTPAGVGPMNHGDKIEVRIEGIGSLVNYVQ